MIYIYIILYILIIIYISCNSQPQQTIPKHHRGAWLQLNELHPICAYLTVGGCDNIIVGGWTTRVVKIEKPPPSKQVFLNKNMFVMTILFRNLSFWIRCTISEVSEVSQRKGVRDLEHCLNNPISSQQRQHSWTVDRRNVDQTQMSVKYHFFH